MDWQAIESAPRDGQRIIGFTPFGVEMVRFAEAQSLPSIMGDDARGWQSGWWGVEQDSDCQPEFHSPLRGVIPEKSQPTHWMPLPDAPEQNKNGS